MGTGDSGKDVTVSVGFNGAPQDIFDDITGFEVEPILTDSSTQVLGQDGLKTDVEWHGWQGSLDIEISGSALDDLLDALVLAAQGRVPYFVAISEQAKHRNLSVKSYTYPNCKVISAQKRARAGEKNAIQLRWKTGSNRIPV